jgi:hypothetical protein
MVFHFGLDDIIHSSAFDLPVASTVDQCFLFLLRAELLNTTASIYRLEALTARGASLTCTLPLKGAARITQVWPSLRELLLY